MNKMVARYTVLLDTITEVYIYIESRLDLIDLNDDHWTQEQRYTLLANVPNSVGSVHQAHVQSKYKEYEKERRLLE